MLGETVLHNSINQSKLIPVNVRKLSRTLADFVPGLGTVARRIATECMITAYRTTACHYHTTNDHSSLINDESPPKKHPYRVTGVAWEKTSEVQVKKRYFKAMKATRPLKAEKLHGIKRPPFIRKRSGRFTLEQLESFFPLREGVRYLHCGCVLEDVLLDFFFWKSSEKLISPSTGEEDSRGKPFDPRTRYIICRILNDQFGVFVNDLYEYDTRGVYRAKESRLPLRYGVLGALFQKSQPSITAGPSTQALPLDATYIDPDDYPGQDDGALSSDTDNPTDDDDDDDVEDEDEDNAHIGD